MGYGTIIKVVSSHCVELESLSDLTSMQTMTLIQSFKLSIVGQLLMLNMWPQPLYNIYIIHMMIFFSFSKAVF